MYMKNKRKLTPWLYSMPALILIGMVIVFPIIYTGYISLTNMNLFHWSNYEFIGLSNYSRALLKADSGFLGALFTTLLWTALNMVIQVVVAYFIALGFQGEDFKGKRVYKTLLMFPWAMPDTARRGCRRHSARPASSCPRQGPSCRGNPYRPDKARWW